MRQGQRSGPGAGEATGLAGVWKRWVFKDKLRTTEAVAEGSRALPKESQQREAVDAWVCDRPERGCVPLGVSRLL